MHLAATVNLEVERDRVFIERQGDISPCGAASGQARSMRNPVQDYLFMMLHEHTACGPWSNNGRVWYRV